jgi:hypothetical protein
MSAPLRRLLLAANADSMDLAVSTAEAFGQHEALTVRLKHIVEMYADGPGILCELVQVQPFRCVLLSGIDRESWTVRNGLQKPGLRPVLQNAEASGMRVLSLSVTGFGREAAQCVPGTSQQAEDL